MDKATLQALRPSVQIMTTDYSGSSYSTTTYDHGAKWEAKNGPIRVSFDSGSTFDTPLGVSNLDLKGPVWCRLDCLKKQSPGKPEDVKSLRRTILPSYKT